MMMMMISSSGVINQSTKTHLRCQ